MALPALRIPWLFAQPQPQPSQPPPPQQPIVPSPAEPPESPEAALLALLDQFRHGSADLPLSSRVDPSLKTAPVQPIVSLSSLWRYGAFITQKTTDVLYDFVSHHVWGPRKKSWSVQMTLISAIMRNVGQYSALGNINLIRALMSLSGILPPSSDALVTPITFRVRRRKLRGLLAEFDALEDGKREITAEWVVSKGLWRRLQAEWKRGKESGSGKGGVRRGRVVLYLHGGAYYVFNAATHRPITIPLSKYCDARVFAINYRLAPETHFPGPLHDAVSAYLRLVEDMQIPPENILIAGDSAGGGLSTALAMYLRDNGYPLPSGLILMSPWVDLTMSLDSWASNSAYDIVPLPPPDSHLNPVACYLGPAGLLRYLTHPYASPLFGRFEGLPPMLVQCGEAEVLRDEGALLAHKAAMEGVVVRHEVFEDAVHVFQMFPFLPATAKAFESARDFVRHTIPEHRRNVRAASAAASTQSEPPPIPDTSTFTTTTTTTTASDEGDGEVAKMEMDPDAAAALDSETVEAHEASMVVKSDGEEVLAVGEEAVKREMERAGSVEPEGTDSGAEVDLSITRAPSPAPAPAASTTTLSSQPQPARRARRPTHVVSMSVSYAPAPAPRSRALSHPDMADLLRTWEEEGPAMRTATWRAGAGASERAS